MNMSLKKFRSKEDIKFATDIGVLQNKIEDIQKDILDVEGIIATAEGGVQDNKDGYVVEVDNRITEEKDKLAQHIEKLSGEQLMSSSTESADALKQLQRIKKDFDDSMGKLNRYKTYQEALEIQPQEIKELAEFQKKFEVRNNLWVNRKVFNEKAQIWLNKSFREQDCNEIVNTIKEYERQNLVFRTQLPRDVPDQVLEALKTEVKEIAVYSNLIVALGNKALEEKHWDKIFSLTDMPKPSSLNIFTL